MKNLFTLLFLAILLSSCTPRNQEESKTVFRYNESAGITSLDPAFARDQANIWAVNQLYNGLVQLDDQLNVKPCIAKTWTVSPDGKTYTFFLRQDVYFHDSPCFSGGKGRKVTAGDFVYSFNRLMDASTVSPGAWVFRNVKHTDAELAFHSPNDSVFSITLNQSFPPFAGLLSMQYCSVVPREAIEYYGADFRRNPVGTGPFRFGMWKENVKLVLLRNPGYFESDGNQQLPYLDAIAVSFIVDKQTAFLEFIKGNLDFLSGIHAGYKDELLTPSGQLNSKYSGSINLVRGPYLNTEYLGLLVDPSVSIMRDNPLLKKEIRQALSYGFDRVKMMHYLRNNIGIPGIYGFVPPGLPWFESGKIKGYTYNPNRARELLADAGFPGGKGLAPITLVTNASYIDLCKFIQSQLNEIGFQIKIDVTPAASLREMVAHSKVPFFRGSWIADYPDPENYLSLFVTSNLTPAGPNYCRYSRESFDALYQQAIREQNDSLRGLLYLKMDQMIMDDAPVIVLYYDEVLRFTHNTVEGLWCNPLNLLTLKNVRKNNPR